MRIEFVDRSKRMTTVHQEQAERNLLFALSRFSNHIDAVRVITEDTNGSKGGIDLRCFAQVVLRGLGNVEVTQHAVDVGSGMSVLARRLGRVVARRLKARRAFSRETIRNPAGFPMESAPSTIA